MAKIIIVGGSLGGLFAANLLLKRGHEITLLEKVVGSLDGRGAGIVTHPSLMKALRLCGIKTDNNIGVPVDRRVTIDQSGNSIESVVIPQILTSWSKLYHLLKENFPKHLYLDGKSVHSIQQNSASATVYCEDGSSYTGDLIIASDGLRSSVRNIFAPSIVPEYAGYVAWRGVCDEYLLSQYTLSTLFETFGFGLPPGEQILGYPVAGLNNNISPGHRRYNFVWYRKTNEEELVNLLTDADNQYYPQGISPIKVNWRNIANVRQAARKTLAPQWAEILEKTALVFSSNL
jgi:2-polyprenyl-6-methoxyphenol hydroxylase-like FAD-dependent oxidoreductase